MGAESPDRDTLPHPMQPIGWDGAGVIRFRENRIVSALLNIASEHGFDLNTIARDIALGRFSEEDMVQLAQLIGYSVSGFGDLRYVPRAMIRRADAKATKIAKGE